MRRTKAAILLACVLAISLLLLLFIHGEEQPLPVVETVTQEALSAFLSGLECRDKRESDGTMTVSGVPAAYADGRYYVPEPLSGEAYTKALGWSRQNRRACLVASGTDKAEAMANGTAFSLYVLAEDGYFIEQVVFTGLPVIALTSDAKLAHAVQPDETGALLRLYTPYEAEVATSVAAFRKRGGSSARHPKFPYRLTLYQNNGNRNQLPLLSMEPRWEWALIPLYTDVSRVREKVCLDLWNDLAKTDPDSNPEGARAEYAELIIDGEYRGLFLLSEMVDQRKLALNKGDGSRLFKVLEYFWDGLRAEYEADPRTLSRIVELKYPAGEDPALWRPMYDYVDRYILGRETEPAGEACAPNMKNAIDHAIFVNVCGADDNLFKNVYYLFRPGTSGYLFTKIPWDMNYSFGDHHQSGIPLRTAFFPDSAYEPCMPPDLSAVMASDAAVSAAIAGRWNELRQTLLTGEGLKGRFLFEMELLTASGAFARDAARWPESKPDAALDGIGEYIDERLSFLDGYFAAMGSGG